MPILLAEYFRPVGKVDRKTTEVTITNFSPATIRDTAKAVNHLATASNPNLVVLAMLLLFSVSLIPQMLTPISYRHTANTANIQNSGRLLRCLLPVSPCKSQLRQTRPVRLRVHPTRGTKIASKETIESFQEMETGGSRIATSARRRWHTRLQLRIRRNRSLRERKVPLTIHKRRNTRTVDKMIMEMSSSTQGRMKFRRSNLQDLSVLTHPVAIVASHLHQEINCTSTLEKSAARAHNVKLILMQTR